MASPTKIFRVLVIQFLLVLGILNSPSYTAQEPEPVDRVLQGSNTGLSLGSNYERKLKFWNSLSPAQQQAIRERAKDISPEKIRTLRLKANRFRSLPQEARERIKKNHHRFRAMPAQRRAFLKKHFSERRNIIGKGFKKGARSQNGVKGKNIRDRTHNSPGNKVGKGTHWQNPPGRRGGPGAGPKRANGDSIGSRRNQNSGPKGVHGKGRPGSKIRKGLQDGKRGGQAPSKGRPGGGGRSGRKTRSGGRDRR